MAEWVIESSIGERRAALIADARILATMIERDSDGLRVGAVVEARLVDKRLKLASTHDGIELFVPRWPDQPEGTLVRLLIRRMALPERDLVKRAVAFAADPATPLGNGPDINQRAVESGWPVRTPRFGEDALGDAGWGELLDEAAGGIIPFPGGLLRLSLTPAMTVVDVDGEPAGMPLATAALAALARVIRRHAVSGNIIIDLPTLPDAAARKTAAAAFDAAMAMTAIPFERTAINGFGLLQIIIPRERPSLFERVQLAPVESAALALLRQAERARGAGPLTLTAHPAVAGWLDARSALLAELARRTGRATSLQPDALRAMGAGHAQ